MNTNWMPLSVKYQDTFTKQVDFLTLHKIGSGVYIENYTQEKV